MTRAVLRHSMIFFVINELGTWDETEEFDGLVMV